MVTVRSPMAGKYPGKHESRARQLSMVVRSMSKQRFPERQPFTAPKVDFHDRMKNNNVVCHFAGLANVLFNNGIDIGRNRLFQDFRNTGDIQRHNAYFTQKALDRKIGQNVQTGEFEHNGIAQLSFRAFLNYKGICEVFDRHNLTQAQRDAVMRDLTAADEPLSPEGYFENEVA